MSMTEEQLFNMSDAEVEAMYLAAKAEEASPDTTYEQESSADDSVDNEEYESADDVGEEFDDDPEQPVEGSDDHDTSDEADDDAESDEDTSTGTEDTLDGEADVDGDGTTDGKAEEDVTPQQVQKYAFKAHGQEYEFTESEIMEKFPKVFGQAMDYTKKMQAIKPWRKTIDALEQAKLGHDDINLAIDVLKGDKDAIAEVLKRTGIDTLDLDTQESKYVAKDYGRDESTLAIKEVVDVISKDAEFEITQNILAKEWDEGSWAEMAKDPQLISLLHTDVKSGMFNIIKPRLDKMKLYDGGKRSDLDYYKMAAKEYFGELNQQRQTESVVREQQQRAEAQRAEKARIAEVKSAEEKRKATQTASTKRKAATLGKSKAGSSVLNYFDDDDEAFEEWYKDTME